MNICSTCGTHAKSFDPGIRQADLSPTRRPGEKLEFVEHVLGVLIESRFGSANPYARLGERPVTTGHSQMFANVRLLSAAEIDEHLNSLHRPFHYALLCGCLCELCEPCVKIPDLSRRAAKDAKGTQGSWDVPCMSPPSTDGNQIARGSPTLSGACPLSAVVDGDSIEPRA